MEKELTTQNSIDDRKDTLSKKDKVSVHSSQGSQLKKVFDFKIAGVSYKIKSSHDEATVNELVQYVNDKVMSAMSITKNSSFQNAAVLAALNIAEEHILLKKKAFKELQSLEDRAVKLCQKLENSKIDESN